MKRVKPTGNATTELAFAALLREHHITGWRRHAPILGKPDFSWARERVLVFVDGCFWHGHDCKRQRYQNNGAVWRAKIRRNVSRDKRNRRSLRGQGWFVIRVWECGLRKTRARIARRVATVLAERRDAG